MYHVRRSKRLEEPMASIAEALAKAGIISESRADDEVRQANNRWKQADPPPPRQRLKKLSWKEKHFLSRKLDDLFCPPLWATAAETNHEIVRSVLKRTQVITI